MPPTVLILDACGESRDIVAWMKRANVHAGGFAYMTPKFRFYVVGVRRLGHRAANILKQELLSLGHDAAVSMDVSMFRDGEGDVLFGATRRALDALAEKLAVQPFGLRETGRLLREAADRFDLRHPNLPLPGGRSLALGDRPLVMGVLNVTPDSFSDGGKFADTDAAVARALEMEAEGADVIDVGGESTRPGAAPVASDEELRRVAPVVAAIRKRSAVPVSVDTMKAAVARAALDAGADIINDVSAGRFDEAMLPLAAERGVPVILMHMQGEPRTMQQSPAYEDVLFDVADFLRLRADAARRAGVSERRIILDPGIGFGKTLAHNVALLRRLRALRSLGHPILVGVSRKSFLGKILDADTDERLEGGLAAQTAAYAEGARLFRTHDVRAARRALDTLAAMRAAPSSEMEEAADVERVS